MFMRSFTSLTQTYRRLTRRHRLLQGVIILVLTAGLTVAGTSSDVSSPLSLGQMQPVMAQRVRAEEVWKEIYSRLPSLPLENQYVSNVNGKVADDNTLVGRLIRYHLYVKGRPPQYRLDWKVTLADYLGVNELMQESSYPGVETLRKNPLEGDRAAIRRLTLEQRNALVQALVNIFNPSASSASSAPMSVPGESSTAPAIDRPSLPNPGDAGLLKP